MQVEEILMTESPITSVHALQEHKQENQTCCNNCGKETVTKRFLLQTKFGVESFSRPISLCRDCTQIAAQFLMTSWEPERM
jgi:hypothetical protein